MVGQTTAITAARSDYPSGVFAVYGNIPPDLKSMEDLTRSAGCDVLAIPDDVWKQASSVAPNIARDSYFTSMSAKPLRGLVSFSDGQTRRALQISGELGLQDAGFRKAAENSLDKSTVYSLLKGRGIRVANFASADSVADLAGAIRSLGLPAERIIVKPSRGSASEGVFRPNAGDSPDDISRQAALEIEGLGFTGGFVVMEYLPAPDRHPAEVCLDGVMLSGSIRLAAVGEKVRQEDDAFYRDRLIVTPPITTELSNKTQQLIKFSENALRALAVENAVFHIEFRFTGSGDPVPIDVALRPGGGFIPESLLATLGIDLRLMHLLINLGSLEIAERLVGSANGSGASAIGAFYIEHRGDLDGSRVAATARALQDDDSVIAFHLMTELTKSTFFKSDGGLSLCVAAADPAQAVTQIQTLAESHSFK